jgi:beta-glucosidase
LPPGGSGAEGRRGVIDANGTLRASVEVTNIGARDGEDVVQLYVTTPGAQAALERPRKRLRGFQKLSLRTHETRRVEFTLKIEDLAFFDQSLGHFVVDPGRYALQIGRSSADSDVQQQMVVTVTGALRPVPAVVTVKPQAAGDRDLGILRRVMFPRGAVVEPQVTVAMNDDSLFGFVARDASRPLPSGMRVRYDSNRPHVVAVDRHGVIRTVGPGVATVTATVELRGVTRSVDFAVYVR